MVLDSLHAAEGNKTATTRDNSVKCTILSKGTIIMDLVIAELSDIYVKQCSIVLDCIINQGNITSILNSRFSVFNRLGMKDYLSSIGLKSKIELLKLTHGVSLSDCLWVRFDGENLDWKDVNPYSTSHVFDVNWLIDKGNPLLNIVIPNYSSSGQFAKCWYTDNSVHKLIKCGSSGAYNAGIEPVSEVLFTQIADALKFNNYVKYDFHYVDYTGTNYVYRQPSMLREVIGSTHKRLATVCECFAGESGSLITAKKLGLSSYKDCIDFAKKHTLNHIDMANILLCDCVGFNEDRHSGNVGFLYNPDTMEIMSVAPMYDNNLSLLCYWDDRDNVNDYVLELCAKDGSTFDKLAELVFDEYPVLYHKLKSANITLSSPVVCSDRVNMLNEVVRKNINKLLLV